MSVSIQKLHNYYNARAREGVSREKERRLVKRGETAKPGFGKNVRALPIAEVCQQVSSSRLSANGSFSAAPLPPRLAAPA